METSNPLFKVSSVSYLSWWTYGKSYSGYQVFYVENSHLFPHSSYTDGHRYILSIPEVMEASKNSSCNFVRHIHSFLLKYSQKILSSHL